MGKLYGFNHIKKENHTCLLEFLGKTVAEFLRCDLASYSDTHTKKIIHHTTSVLPCEKTTVLCKTLQQRVSFLMFFLMVLRRAP